MGGLKQFRIFFDKPDATYYSGQSIVGHVLLILTEPKRFRGIDVKFKGKSQVMWREGTGDDSETFTDKELYFTGNINLVGKETVLSAGEYTFPFQIQLPMNTPPSYEGKHGRIRYTVKAIMDRPWKFNHTVKARFIVLAHVDLNLHPHVKEPVIQQKSKSLSCCCFSYGHISLVTKVPFTGFVPGQNIPICVRIENRSNDSITNIGIRLNQVVSFHCRKRKKVKTTTVKTKVASLDLGPLQANNFNTWNRNVLIPPVPPSILMYCSIIDLDYHAMVKAEFSGLHRKLHVETPIVVGTVPLPTHCPPPDASTLLPPAFNDVVAYGTTEPWGHTRCELQLA